MGSACTACVLGMEDPGLRYGVQCLSKARVWVNPPKLPELPKPYLPEMRFRVRALGGWGRDHSWGSGRYQAGFRDAGVGRSWGYRTWIEDSFWGCFYGRT